MKFVKIALFLVPALILGACSKKTSTSATAPADCTNAVRATLTDMSKTDGCGWVITLNSGEVLEPTNLKEFDIKLKKDKAVRVSYENLRDRVSSCMSGKPVKVICIVDVK